MKDNLKAACLKEMFTDDEDYGWEKDSYSITLTGDDDGNVILRVTGYGQDGREFESVVKISNPNGLLSALNAAAIKLKLDYDLAEDFIAHHCPNHVMERFTKP